MALVKSKLKAQIKSLLNELKTEEDQDASIEKFADRLSACIDEYIKSATVNTSVVGSSVSGGAVTGTGTGTIS